MNANIVPQDRTLNVVDWLRLENLTRKLIREICSSEEPHRSSITPSGGVEKKNGKLYVVSGPVFLPTHVSIERCRGGAVMLAPCDHSSTSRVCKQIVQYELTGKGNQMVAVPTHLYKVLLAKTYKEDGGVRYESAAFVLPNKPIIEELPLWWYQVPMEKLEHVTGLSFFPYLNRSQVGDLCQSYQCNIQTEPLFRRYRQVAWLQHAESIPELRRIYTHLESESFKKKETVDTVIQKEYQRRVKELAAETVSRTSES
ncbi:unnamed protein product [Phytomonas sp. EM1]|nr:unnamed protein product [Phytomonas sp. EM1]|eukprot:CCW63593.1 unnamed protein product [Phytomonas sp. isolate EM1]